MLPAGGLAHLCSISGMAPGSQSTACSSDGCGPLKPELNQQIKIAFDPSNRTSEMLVLLDARPPGAGRIQWVLKLKRFRGKGPPKILWLASPLHRLPPVPAGYALCQTHHRYIDISKCEVVHGKVGCDLHSHGGHDDRVIPELGVVQDIGQADEGHVLGK